MMGIKIQMTDAHLHVKWSPTLTVFDDLELQMLVLQLNVGMENQNDHLKNVMTSIRTMETDAARNAEQRKGFDAMPAEEHAGKTKLNVETESLMLANTAMMET